MSDRVKGFIVTLDREYREEDDGETIRNAIRMIKGVLSVDPVSTSPDDHINRVLIRSELEKKLWAALREK
jgi:hypothetical protein